MPALEHEQITVERGHSLQASESSNGITVQTQIY